MGTAHSHQPEIASPRKRRRRFFLSIGLRLFFAFLIIISLTALIGFLAVQHLSDLAGATNELNTKDLPEVRMLGSLRSYVFQQYDLEQQLVANGLNEQEISNPTTTTKIVVQYVVHCTPLVSSSSEGEGGDGGGQLCITTAVNVPVVSTSPAPLKAEALDFALQNTLLTSLSVTLKNIVKQHALFMQQESLNSQSSQSVATSDTPLEKTITTEIAQTIANSQRIQSLLKQKQYTQAFNLEQGVQNTLFQKLLTNITQIRALDTSEINTVALQAQQNSSDATMLIFVLTALALLLSIIMAVFITRSLTGTLSKLVKASDSIAAGNLDEEPMVVRRDELGHLAEAFDRMRLGLRSTIATLALERQRTQAIIDTGVDGVMLVDGQGTILQFNPAAEQLSGWSVCDALGKPCWEVFVSEDTPASATAETEETQSLWKRIIQTDREQQTAEMEIVIHTGQHRWLAVSAASLPNDDIARRGLVIGLHDISELKAIDQLKTDFVAMVSHELRAPLTTVSGSVEMLDLLDPAVDSDTYDEVVGILKQQTQRLRQVVEEVLQLTRLDAGRLQVQLEPLSIAQFCRNLQQQIGEDWVGEDRELRLFVPGDDVLIWADMKVLEVVVRNLLENARKYTPDGSPIEIEVNILPAVSRVNVLVRDYGPGIPADQLPHIFERFSRGTQSSYDWSRGYGLGLYIARELLKAHNGDIWAENCPDQGACFTISLCRVTDQTVMLPPPDNLSSEHAHTAEEVSIG